MRMPPSSRPMAAPPPAIAPKMPNALPRSFGSVKVVVSSDSAAGASSAPNTPCSGAGGDEHAEATARRRRAADATAKPIRPAMNVRLRPKRSARRPPSSSRLPKASE